MPEIIKTTNPEISETQSEASESRRATTAPILGSEALSAASVQSFYGATDAYLGHTVGGSEVRLIIKNLDGSNEVVAKGNDVGDTLTQTLEAMRSIEIVDTAPITRFAVDGNNVSFTELKHYAPRIAPSSESYSVPVHLEGVLKDDSIGMDTYETTIEKEGWQKELFEQLDDYASQDESVNELVRDLNIASLSALTPEQAVKLSLGVVQSFSKYSWIQEGEKRVAGGEREDTMTTMELLAEGRTHIGDAVWGGNGVCRNIASNVKAVFEALKANQNGLSMLRNTYAVYEGGTEGYGTKKREDVFTFSLNNNGHAWNTFVTIGKNGESSITTVDATWAMGRDKDGSLKEPDYTSERMYENIATIATGTTDKIGAALAMSESLNRVTRIVPGEDLAVREQRMQFALTEWLKVAPLLVEADMQSVPNGIVGAAYRLGARLDKSELQTLFTVQEAGWIETFDAILGKYIDGKSPIKNSDRFIVRGDKLQRVMYEKLGSRAEEYANQSTDFRIRLREINPDALPDFDPMNNPADKSELSSLIQNTGLFSMGNKYYGDVLRAGLLKAAEGRQDVVDRLTTSMSDYVILRHYRDIRLAAMKG